MSNPSEAVPVALNMAPRSCLVCQEPCMTEGQLCPDCVAKGHRVTDDEVIVSLEIRLPDWMR